MNDANLSEITRHTDHGNAIAIIDYKNGRTRSFTYSELNNAIDSLATTLLQEGRKPNERIAILSKNCYEYLIVYFGVLRAGLIAVPINYRNSAPEVQRICEHASVVSVYCSDEYVNIVPSSVECRSINVADPKTANLDGFVAPLCDVDSVALILYTSGSTGQPKGVQLTHAGQKWMVDRRCATNIADYEQRMLIAAPLYHMNALGSAQYALGLGETAVLLPEFDCQQYIRAISEQRCTWLTSVPTMMAMVCRSSDLANIDRSGIRKIGMGSGPVSLGLLNTVKEAFPNAEVLIGYGTTECGAAAFGPHPAGLPRPSLSVGFPSPDTDVRLGDSAEDGGDKGILYVRCPANSIGYLEQVSLTSELFSADGFYRTDDIFYRDSNGFYFFVDRADDMFVCGGENIYPAEIERVIDGLPGVSQSCVVPAPHELKGAKPVAYVVLKPGMSLSEENIKHHALKSLAAYKHPRRVFFLDSMSMNASQKVDRKVLMRKSAHVLEADST